MTPHAACEVIAEIYPEEKQFNVIEFEKLEINSERR
jgi:uncharacterized protein YqfB (UPF0267 family)